MSFSRSAFSTGNSGTVMMIGGSMRTATMPNAVRVEQPVAVAREHVACERGDDHGQQRRAERDDKAAAERAEELRAFRPQHPVVVERGREQQPRRHLEDLARLLERREHDQEDRNARPHQRQRDQREAQRLLRRTNA